MPSHPTHRRQPSEHHGVTSTVLAVVLRVAGPVLTGIHPHAIGTPERQVSARIGDALVYLTDPAVAARIRQHWDAAQYLAVQRLPEQVSQTWLAPDPERYPLGICVQLSGPVEVTTKWVPAAHANGIPAHLRIRVDRLVWQVCDKQAWRVIGDAWFDAQRHLEQYPGRDRFPPPELAGDAAPMNTTQEHRWSITAISATTVHRQGVASGLPYTWTEALTAGRVALLAGELDTLAVSIDGELEAMHTPGLTTDGTLDPQDLTAALVEIHQCVTAHLLAEQLADGRIDTS